MYRLISQNDYGCQRLNNMSYDTVIIVSALYTRKMKLSYSSNDEKINISNGKEHYWHKYR